MKFIKSYKIFEADASFFYEPKWEDVLPKEILVLKGDQKNPRKILYTQSDIVDPDEKTERKNFSRHIGPMVQIPYQIKSSEEGESSYEGDAGRTDPDTLEFDVYWDYDTNNHCISINVEVNYGDLTACQFQIKSPNKIKHTPKSVRVIRYTSLHSQDDKSNTVFALDNNTIQCLCDYFNQWDESFNQSPVTPKDIRFLDGYDNYLPT
jgi:hypothetical protein